MTLRRYGASGVGHLITW